MPRCPVCAGDNVRRSRKKPARDFFKRWRGLQRYRCLECRKVFYQPLHPWKRARTAGEPPQGGASQEVVRPSLWRRRVADLFLFLAMVVVFYVALKYFGRAS